MGTYPQAAPAGGKIIGSITATGKLALTDAKPWKLTLLQTCYEGAPRSIFSVSCERDGRIYGGTFSPAISFYCDTRSGKLAELGELAARRILADDTLNHPSGLFLGSYMPASVDFFDPARLLKKHPRPPRTAGGLLLSLLLARYGCVGHARTSGLGRRSRALAAICA